MDDNFPVTLFQRITAVIARYADSPLETTEQRDEYEALIRDALGHGAQRHEFTPGGWSGDREYCYFNYPYRETDFPDWPWSFCGLLEDHAVHGVVPDNVSHLKIVR